MLTRITAAQAGPDGVRANCIAPETILTASNGDRIPPDVAHRLAHSHPLRRLGQPVDVAHAALYLAGDADAWVTGTILDVGGGGSWPNRTARPVPVPAILIKFENASTCPECEPVTLAVEKDRGSRHGRELMTAAGPARG